MPFRRTFKRASAQSRPKRRPIWRIIFSTLHCCSRTYDEDDGLTGEYTLTPNHPIPPSRSPNNGPIQDPSYHVTASWEMKKPSSPVLSSLSHHVTASWEMKKPSSPVLSCLGEDESTHVSDHHNTLPSALISTSPKTIVVLRRNISEPNLSIGRHIECNISKNHNNCNTFNNFRDFRTIEPFSSPVNVLNSGDGATSTQSHKQVAFRCQMLNFAIPSTLVSATRCQSAPAVVCLANISIKIGRNCLSLIVAGTKRNTSRRLNHAAPHQLNYGHSLRTVFSKATSALKQPSLVETASLPLMSSVSYGNKSHLPGLTCTTSAATPIRDVTSSCRNHHVIPLMRTPVTRVSNIPTNLIPQKYGTERTLLSSNGNFPAIVGHLSSLHPVSTEVTYIPENHVGLVQCVSPKREGETPSHAANGYILPRFWPSNDFIPFDHSIPADISTQQSTDYSRDNALLPIIPAATTAKDVTTVRWSDGIDNNDAHQLPFPGQSGMPAWNITTNWPVDSNRFHQGASNFAIGCQPLEFNWNLPWESTAPGVDPTAELPFQTPKYRPLGGSPTIPKYRPLGGSPTIPSQNNAAAIQPTPSPASKNVYRGPWNNPYVHNVPATSCLPINNSYPDHSQNTNAAFNPQVQNVDQDPFRNYTGGFWDMQQSALQSQPPKLLKPSDYGLPSTCEVIPKNDLTCMYNEMSVPVTLGSGSFGQVRLMRHISSGSLCAVKCYHEYHEEQYIIKDLQRETAMLTSLRHLDCVPKLIGISRIGRDTDIPVLVQEFVGDPVTGRATTIADVIENKTLNGPGSFSAAIKLCRAMKDIHLAGMLHCDLKPDNIMLLKGPSGEDGDVHIKIIDFGKAVLMTDKPTYEYFPRDEHDKIRTQCAQLAPEVVEGRRPYSLYSDIYSLGLVILNLEASPDKFLKKLGMRCMAFDWRKRPNIQEIIQDLEGYIKKRQISYGRWRIIG